MFHQLKVRGKMKHPEPICPNWTGEEITCSWIDEGRFYCAICGVRLEPIDETKPK